MNKLRKLLENRNIGWRLLSLVLAFFVWFVCITYIDPNKTVSFTVQLQFRNEDALQRSDKFLQNRLDLEGKEIRIEVSGRTNVIDALKDTSFTAYIDLGKAEILNATQINEYIQTNVIVPSIGDDVKITRQDPMEISIKLDKIITKTFPVTVSQAGAVKEGFIAQPHTASPATVKIRGAQTTISTIAFMNMEANINEADGNIVFTDTPRAYDENNNEVKSDLFDFVDASVVTVTVPVYKVANLSISAPTIKGEPLEGYVVAGSPDWTPKTVEVMGPAEDIDNRKPVELEPVDVTGTSQDIEAQYDLRGALGKNLRLVNPDDSTLTVSVTIEPIITQEFTIPVSNLTVSGMLSGMQHAMITEEVTVTVSGRKTQVERMTTVPGTLTLSDITEEGEYPLTVDWRPPNGITVVSEPSIVLVNVRIPVVEIPTDEPLDDGTVE